ncbi:glycosyltransferase family 2 protein [Moheibacter sediminis]|uniref:Glycosyltransferase, GT2 family n=1 Tax=Moheibacter sediminis TaxID=1434700 RepID=A0A1W1ZN15_9FLAO|nr:glycosyltransferase family 2 protein [Moheibacter sediminis]SMC49915.1 Glycosyltransferase, GT2 family [Moheibacter sediminis]
MSHTDISVIIINFNTSQLTFDCINSIKEFESNSALSIEFIVVDNASQPTDYENLNFLLENQPDVKIVKSRINSGFALGNMLGVQHATGKHYAFINSDVLFLEPVFSEMKKFLSENPSAALCGIQILDENKDLSISHRDFEGIRYKLFGKKFLKLTRPDHSSMLDKITSPTEVDFVIGSFMFFDAEKFCETGGFDTNLFLYYEEMDICLRLKKKNYKTYFLPDLKYVHLEGKSSGQNIQLKTEHYLSYLYIARKNFGFWKYKVIKNYMLLCYLFKAPFKAKNTKIFLALLRSQQSLAQSMRHNQKVQF